MSVVDEETGKEIIRARIEKDKRKPKANTATKVNAAVKPKDKKK